MVADVGIEPTYMDYDSIEEPLLKPASYISKYKTFIIQSLLIKLAGLTGFEPVYPLRGLQEFNRLSAYRLAHKPTLNGGAGEFWNLDNLLAKQVLFLWATTPFKSDSIDQDESVLYCTSPYFTNQNSTEPKLLSVLLQCCIRSLNEVDKLEPYVGIEPT